MNANFSQSTNLSRLVERIRQCVQERERGREQKPLQMKLSSITHYTDYLQRSIEENPLVGQVLFRLYHLTKNFTRQTNRFSSTLILESNESTWSLDAKTSLDHLYTASSDLDLSNTNLPVSPSIQFNPLPSMKSVTHTLRPTNVSRQPGGLLTKATQIAISKAPHQRTAHDIEVLMHLLDRCECLRRFPLGTRRYAARSSLLLTYQAETILTRTHAPSFLVYMIVSGQCRLLLENNRNTLLGRTLNIGDVYGDETLQSITEHRLIGLITAENSACSLVAFFPRDIRAYDKYLSEMMRRTLLEQFRMQPSFVAMEWREDIFNYFLKWSTYQQCTAEEIVYGNEAAEHEHLYFILHGQVSFVRLLDFPSRLLRHPELSRFYQQWNDRKSKLASVAQSSDRPSITSSTKTHAHPLPISDETSKMPLTWRFLEVFTLSEGHYFGFETSTEHSWYLGRNHVDLISIPKSRFQHLGLFAPMIFEKLRQDFLAIYPDEGSIRSSYLKNLRIHKATNTKISTIKFTHGKQPLNIDPYDIERLQKIHRPPEQTVLNQYKEDMRLDHHRAC